MWFKSRPSPSMNIGYGAMFRRLRAPEIVETAHIIEVSPDSAGIMHVRFNLQISGPRYSEEDQRTLALESFRSLYRDAVPV
jgi:hypothetical protein